MSQPSENRSLPVEQQPLMIENRNFLSPIGFQFLINKVPGSAFFCQAASIPAISLNVTPVSGRRSNLAVDLPKLIGD